MHGLDNGVEQREQVVEPSQLDGTDDRTRVIDHDVQRLAPSPASAGGVDQGLQTRRALGMSRRSDRSRESPRRGARRTLLRPLPGAGRR